MPEWKVPFSYLPQEFDPKSARVRRILGGIEAELTRGHFTLGEHVTEFEERWAGYCGARYAVGVASGTDALMLIVKSLRAETVVTVPNTFVGTVNAILAAGAKPLFVDIGDDYLMSADTALIKRLAYSGARWPFYIMPVHWGGAPVRCSPNIDFRIIEDAAQAAGASVDGQRVGSLGAAGAFSFHPIKNLCAWGDGGMVTTSDEGLAQEIRTLRNQGLEGRDDWAKPGYNSRLDTVQAIVLLEMMKTLDQVNDARIAIAQRYDQGLKSIQQVKVPARDPKKRYVYHLYQVEVIGRDKLLAHLLSKGVEAKAHYPHPLHLQPALAYLGYKQGDFPRAEAFCRNHITIPCHQFLSPTQVDYVAETIADFYRSSTTSSEAIPT